MLKQRVSVCRVGESLRHRSRRHRAATMATNVWCVMSDQERTCFVLFRAIREDENEDNEANASTPCLRFGMLAAVHV